MSQQDTFFCPVRRLLLHYDLVRAIPRQTTQTLLVRSFLLRLSNILIGKYILIIS